MNEYKKEIIEILEPYMIKELKKWCLIKWKHWNKEINEITLVRETEKWDEFWILYNPLEWLDFCSYETLLLNYDIIGHYNLSCILRFFNKNCLIENRRIFNNSIIIDYWNKTIEILNKDPNDNTEEEDENLLNILKNILITN